VACGSAAHAVDDSGASSGRHRAIDGAQGSSAQQSTEFTPAGLEIKVRSTCQQPILLPGRRQQQDYLGSFSDRPARRQANNAENHRPMASSSDRTTTPGRSRTTSTS